MVAAETTDQSIDIKFDRVGAFIIDGQQSVALSDVGEGGSHEVSVATCDRSPSMSAAGQHGARSIRPNEEPFTNNGVGGQHVV